MENVYTLKGRAAELAAQYDELQARLEDLYIENGGEVTPETEEYERTAAELDALRGTILAEIVANADDYAEAALNAMNAEKGAQAELKAWKDQVKTAETRYKSRIDREHRRAEWWKDNFAAAMEAAKVQKIGGAKTKHLHSIYYTTTKAVQVDEETALAPYAEALEAFRASLPAWCKVEVSIDKTEVKKCEEMPEGVQLVENMNLQIR